MRGIYRITSWLAARQGLELHYPERAEPESERAGTLANDGTPCARPPARATTFMDRHGHNA